MNFLSSMLKAPVTAKPVRKYHREKTRPEYRNSEARYRLYLENTKRTIQQLAALMGLTYNGTRSSVLRMEDRGVVTSCGRVEKVSGGKKPTLYTWIGK